MLNIDNLGNNYLKNISFQVKKGEIYNIVGPNGAGKSTLGKLIAGLENHTTGNIILNNFDVTNLNTEQRAQKGLIYIFQNIPEYSHISVENYFKIFLKEKDIPVELFQRFGMDWEEYKSRRFDSKLSGGERKKIEILLNLHLNASMYILDEVDSGLDFFSVKILAQIIQDFAKDGKSFIIISHNKEFQQICNNGLILCKGIVVKQGPIDQVINMYTKKCFDCGENKC